MAGGSVSARAAERIGPPLVSRWQQIGTVRIAYNEHKQSADTFLLVQGAYRWKEWLAELIVKSGRCLHAGCHLQGRLSVVESAEDAPLRVTCQLISWPCSQLADGLAVIRTQRK